jgi:hypothetical protein
MEAQDRPLSTVEIGRIHFDPSNELREGLALFVQNPKTLTLKTTHAIGVKRLPGGAYSDGRQAREIIDYTTQHLDPISGHQLPLLSSIRQSRPDPDTLRFYFQLVPDIDDRVHFGKQPAFRGDSGLLDVYTDVELRYYRSLGKQAMQRAVKSLKQVMRIPEVGNNHSRFADRRHVFATGARLLFTYEAELEPLPPTLDEDVEAKAS